MAAGSVCPQLPVPLCPCARRPNREGRDGVPPTRTLFGDGAVQHARMIIVWGWFVEGVPNNIDSCPSHGPRSPLHAGSLHFPLFCGHCSPSQAASTSLECVPCSPLLVNLSNQILVRNASLRFNLALTDQLSVSQQIPHPPPPQPRRTALGGSLRQFHISSFCG